METQLTPLANVRLLDFTRPLSPVDPLQVGFTVLTNKEEIIVANIPSAVDLFSLFKAQGWIKSAPRMAGRPTIIHEVTPNKRKYTRKHKTTAVAA